MIYHVGLTDPNTMVTVEADTMATIADMLVFINGSEYGEGMARVAAFPTERVVYAAAETALTDFRVVGGSISLMIPPLQSSEQRQRDRELLSYAPAIARPLTNERQTVPTVENGYNSPVTSVDGEDAQEFSAPIWPADAERNRVVFHDEVLPTVRHVGIEAFDPTAPYQGVIPIHSTATRSTSPTATFSNAYTQTESNF